MSLEGTTVRLGTMMGLSNLFFYVTEAITVLQWSRLSDNIGRKPVLLIGLLGSTLSMLAFGLSRTFWALVVSRCLTGLLNGNIGVMKSVMGEFTDPTNRAKGYSLLSIVWCLGATVGPMIGGSLAHPHERFPKVFSGSFWRDYPYFLPCLVVSMYIISSFLIALFMLKETLPTDKSRQSLLESCDDADSIEKPVPLRKLLVYPVVVSVANYGILAFLQISASSLIPLFLAMPLEIGGLKLSPPAIGYIIGSFGILDSVFQASFFSSIVRRWGERNVCIASMSAFIPIFLILPSINFVARTWGQTSLGVWLLLGLLLVMLTLMDMGYGVTSIYITASAPNRRSLGATNGLSQTTVSIARSIGPALSTSLFSFSAERNILGGTGVYVFFAICSIFAVHLATLLPSKVWDQDESTHDTEYDNGLCRSIQDTQSPGPPSNPKKTTNFYD